MGILMPQTKNTAREIYEYDQFYQDNNPKISHPALGGGITANLSVQL